MLDPNNRSFVQHFKKLFDKEKLKALRDYFEEVREERQKPTSDREAMRLKIGASTDAFRLDDRWYDVWRDASEEMIERFQPFSWLLYPPHIRYITGDEHLVPWHQDIGYIKLMPKVHKRVITCFVPLELEPAKHSTVEYAIGDFGYIDHQTGGEHGAIIIKPDFSKKAKFDLEFGDAIVFGDHCPHQSVPGPDGKVNRRSFEFRLILPEEALDDKDYFDIKKSCFVRTDGSRKVAV